MIEPPKNADKLSDTINENSVFFYNLFNQKENKIGNCLLLKKNNI